MTKEEIYTKLNAVFQDVFDDDSIRVNDETTAADIEDWDSLSHITLISSIEAEFGVKFDMKTVLKMKNVGELVSIIQTKLQ